MDLIKNSFLEAQQVLEAFISDEKNLGQVKNAGDLLVDMFRQGGKVFSCGNGGSSTSGNSSNILQAIDTAHVKGMKVIGLTGKTGGKMKEKCDITIVVPWNKYSDRIQEIHIKIIHILIEYIEQALFNTNK